MRKEQMLYLRSIKKCHNLNSLWDVAECIKSLLKLISFPVSRSSETYINSAKRQIVILREKMTCSENSLRKNVGSDTCINENTDPKDERKFQSTFPVPPEGY